MQTATRVIIVASLLAAGCSGEVSDPDMMDAPAGSGTDLGASGTGTMAPGGGDMLPGTGGTSTAPGASGGDTPGTGSTVPGTGSMEPGGSGDPDVDPDDPTVPDEPPIAPSTGVCAPGVPITSQIPRLTNLQYEGAVRDIFNVAPPSGASWSESFQPDSVGELPSTQWNQYKTTAEQIAVEVMGTPLGSELATAAGDVAALETSIRDLGRKMFRRPLTDDEVASFLTLASVEPLGTPDEIAEMVVYSMLISPSFLMRTELDAPELMVPGTEDEPQMAFQLSNYEVASRLSFLIWNSVPDATLDAAADAGELQTSEQIRAQAERMLAAEFSDKVSPVIVQAHRAYANIDVTSSLSRWGKTLHDASLFPEYSEAQNAALLQEMDLLFAEIGYSGEFDDLFLSNVAYVNQDTAPLYGLDASAYGPDLERVELDAMERPGFLTRGSFLSSFANEKSTSPIMRGVFVLTLMGAEPPPPTDPDATKTELPPGDYQTNREAITALTSVEPACVGCHQQVINPPGFVLENFSAVGSMQTEDPQYGGTIDTAVESVAFPTGAKPINNAYEMMTEIAAGQPAKEIYARKWVSYATGREANDFDQCTSNLIADKMAAGGYTLASVLADITQAESFRLRVAAE